MRLVDLFRVPEIQEQKQRKHRCDGCLWGSKAGTKVVCSFSRCVRDNGWQASGQMVKLS